MPMLTFSSSSGHDEAFLPICAYSWRYPLTSFVLGLATYRTLKHHEQVLSDKERDHTLVELYNEQSKPSHKIFISHLTNHPSSSLSSWVSRQSYHHTPSGQNLALLPRS